MYSMKSDASEQIEMLIIAFTSRRPTSFNRKIKILILLTNGNTASFIVNYEKFVFYQNNSAPYIVCVNNYITSFSIMFLILN